MAFIPLEIQKAQIALLSADSALATLVGTRICDFVPDGTIFPYVKVGEATHNDRGSHTTEGFESIVTVDTWDQSTSRLKTLNIMDEIDRLLHNTNWNIDCAHELSIRRSFYTVLVEDDGKTYHGVQQFELLLGEK